MKLNLQALKYIVAIDSHRNFVKAAEACGVSQPTLSTAVKNLENELDVNIFDRNSYPVKPTAIGERIIALARKTLQDASLIEEIVRTEKGDEGGRIELGIIPTIAPYLLPGLFRQIRKEHPAIELKISEMRTRSIVGNLLSAEIDMAILATPLQTKGLLEIPLYYETFAAYVSPEDELYGMDSIPASSLPSSRLWVLEEGHCLRNQIFNFCHSSTRKRTEYEAGSIDTLVKVVDMNGGYTVIPELHIAYLTEQQKQNIRPITGDASEKGQCETCIPVREVSLVIREDFIREKMLNIVADAVKAVIPQDMLDSRLKKFAIKL